MKASLPLIMLLILCLNGCENTKHTSAPSSTHPSEREKDAGTTKTSTDTGILRKRDLGTLGMIEYLDGPMPGSDAVIAETDGVQVTLGEFEFAARFAMFRGQSPPNGLPPERMAMPQIQFTMTQSLLARKVIAKKAKERGLTASREEKVAWMKKQKSVEALVKEGVDPNTLLKPYGIDFDDVLAFVENEVLADKFVDSELERIPKDEVWKAYEMEMNKVHALVASSNNVPTGQEIDQFIAKNPKAIEDYFQKNKRTYRIQKKVKLDIFRIPEGSKLDKKAQKQRLQNAANRMGKGESLETIAKDLQLEIHRSRALIFAENKRAFKSKPGTSGVELQGPRGSYAWIVRGFEAPKDGVLNASTRREIAALLLRNQQISPALKIRMETVKKEVLKNINAKNVKKRARKLGNYGLRWRVVTFKENGFVPEFGLVEELVTDAFQHKKGYIGGPIKSREYVYLYKIFGREFANRKTFEKNYEGNRKAYLDAKRNIIIPQMMSNYQNVKLDIQKIRIKWGVIRKPK